MIQRIQTVYLFLIVLLMGLLLFIPLAEITAMGSIFDFTASGWLSQEGHMSISMLPVMIFLVLLIIYNLLIIFLYKNRLLQVKLAKLNGILLAILIAVVVMSADYVAEQIFSEGEAYTVDYAIGTYVSFFPLIFNYLAIRAIKKDEELVRSADRLR